MYSVWCVYPAAHEGRPVNKQRFHRYCDHAHRDRSQFVGCLRDDARPPRPNTPLNKALMQQAFPGDETYPLG
jgi:hypothetical protein